MNHYSIAVIPGDGIGVEVVPEAIRVLGALEEISDDIQFSYKVFPWGSEYYLKHGKMMEEEGLKTLEQFDAILLGAVGLPALVPDHITLRELLLHIRQGFDQYINLRPIVLLNEDDCPIKGTAVNEVDMVFVRENSEGEYSGLGGVFQENTPEEVVFQTSVFSRKKTQKVMNYAYRLAASRAKKLTSVTKSNALNYSMVFWDKIFQECSDRFPDIATEQYHVDAMAMHMVRRPASFDVVVASNLFGDILTDLGAVLQGGIGYAAAANLNPERTYPSMFEPVHGSAPDIVGKQIANPVAMIWTAKLMLDFMGRENLGDLIAKSIRHIATEQRHFLTPDCGGKSTTKQTTDALIDTMQRIAQEN